MIDPSYQILRLQAHTSQALANLQTLASKLLQIETRVNVCIGSEFRTR